MKQRWMEKGGAVEREGGRRRVGDGKRRGAIFHTDEQQQQQ